MEPGVEQVEGASSSSAGGRRRLALWGVLATVAVGAGALVVATSGDDGVGSSPRLPIALGAGGAGAESAMAADMAMAPWVTYVAADELAELGGTGTAYRLAAPGESDVAALAQAFGFEAAPARTDVGWEASDDTGTLTVSEPGGSWWFTSGAVIGGGGVASCVAPAEGAAGDDPVCEELVACPEPVSPEECESFSAPGQPIEGDPVSAEGAEDIARRLFESVSSGLQLGEVRAEDTGGGPVRWVTVGVRLGDLAVEGFGWSVSVGPEGEIVDASGSLGTVEEVGTYDLLDTRAAIDRLNEQLGAPIGIEPMPLPAEDLPASTAAPAPPSGCKVQPHGSEICEPIGADIICPDVNGTEPICPPDTTIPADCARTQTETTCIPPDTVPCEPAPTTTAVEDPDTIAPPTTVADPDDSVSSGPASPPGGGPPVCPSPVEPPVTTVPPEPTEVQVAGAERILLVTPSFDGAQLYLVPGYRFTAEDGSEPVVAAVVEEALAEQDAAPQTGEIPVEDCVAAVEEIGGTTITAVPSCGQGSPGSEGGTEGKPNVTVVDVAVPLYHCGIEPIVHPDYPDLRWVADPPPFDATNAPADYVGRGQLVLTAGIEPTVGTAALYSDLSGIEVSLVAVGPDWQPPPCA